MKKVGIIVLFFVVFVLVFGCVERKNASGGFSMNKIKVSSSAFSDGESIPQKYSCQGEDISPPLQWDSVPGAKYYAIKVDDPDAPAGTWVHWIVANIPVGKNFISEGEVAGEEITNDFGRVSYGGPCPPSGKHRYYFKVWALSEKLEGAAKQNFDEKVKEKAIAYGELISTYEKR